MTPAARYAQLTLPAVRAAVRDTKAETLAELPLAARIALVPVWWAVSLLLPVWLRLLIAALLYFVGRRYGKVLGWACQCPFLDATMKAELTDIYEAATAPQSEFPPAVVAAVRSPAVD